MVIVEFPNFTKAIKALMSDDDYRKLQAALVENPTRGDLIKGGGGLRKVRWALPGRGKSGGVRVIYYWWKASSRLYMLAVYPKNVQANLTPEQAKRLAKLIEAEDGQDG